MWRTPNPRSKGSLAPPSPAGRGGEWRKSAEPGFTRTPGQILISLDAGVRNSLFNPLGVCVGGDRSREHQRHFFLNKTLLVIVFKYVYNSTLFERKSRPSQHTG